MKPCLLITIYDQPARIEQLCDELASLGLPALIVDDGSGDETRRALERVAARHPWVQRLRHACNEGRGAALQTGYRAAAAAGFTHALQIDADGQHDPLDAPRFIEASARDPEALVLGSPVFDASAPLARRWGRWLSRVWVWIETCSFEIADPLCGYRCVPLPRVLQILETTACGRHMDFDPEIAVRLVWAGAPVVNVPTRVRYFPDGVSHFDMVRDNLRISRAHAALVVGMLPRLPRLIARRAGARR